MPYYKFYEESESFDDEDSEPAGEFHYEFGTASDRFDRSSLDGVSAVLLRLLESAGVTEMRVRYDGGNDEGFAHADDMWIRGQITSLHDVIDLLATPQNISLIRSAAASPKGSYYHDAGSVYAKMQSADVVSSALDELAHQMVSQLLGEGYGTGEYELYGSVTVTLETGEMVDDPDTTPPLN